MPRKPKSRERLVNVAFDALFEEIEAWRTFPSPHIRRGEDLVMLERVPPIELFQSAVVPEDTISRYHLPKDEAKRVIRHACIEKVVERIAQECGVIIA